MALPFSRGYNNSDLLVDLPSSPPSQPIYLFQCSETARSGASPGTGKVGACAGPMSHLEYAIGLPSTKEHLYRDRKSHCKFTLIISLLCLKTFIGSPGPSE